MYVKVTVSFTCWVFEILMNKRKGGPKNLTHRNSRIPAVTVTEGGFEG